jgi:hypothetical protein
MQNELAQHFREQLNTFYAALSALSPDLADKPWREGGWTRKQIVGHLLDSSANNRQRFVRASTAGTYVGPEYAQEEWVNAHGYAQQPWTTLLQWWKVEHEILAAIVDGIPPQTLEVPCTIGTGEQVSLRFLIEDYLRHQRWHLDQLRAPA